jgi:flagellar hook-associated protein 3 FlgL
MTLRTVNPYTSYQTLLDMQRTKSQMADLTQQLSSGNRLTQLGTDPTASALVLDFQNSINKNNAYVDQMNSATSYLSMAETTLSSANDSITRLLEIGQQGMSDTTSASGRASIASEVDGIKSSLLALANTQSQGKYIFAGTQTTTQPFTATATGATYSGDANSINLNVTQSTTVTTNLPGDTVFFGAGGQGSNTDLFTQVTNLKTGLNNNDSAAIQTAYTNLQNILGTINSQMTDLGGRQSMLSQLKDNTQNYNLSLQTIQGSYQDVDYPTVVTEYTKAQTAQQASLSVMAQTNKLNLFDYLT